MFPENGISHETHVTLRYALMGYWQSRGRLEASLKKAVPTRQVFDPGGTIDLWVIIRTIVCQLVSYNGCNSTTDYISGVSASAAIEVCESISWLPGMG